MWSASISLMLYMRVRLLLVPMAQSGQFAPQSFGLRGLACVCRAFRAFLEQAYFEQFRVLFTAKHIFVDVGLAAHAVV